MARQWRTGQNRFAELRRRGVAKFAAAVAAGSPTGLWRMSGHPAVQQALRNDYFESLVFPESMRPPKPNSVEPPRYGPYARWCGGAASRGVPLSRSRADTAPTGPASGRAGVWAKAVIPLRTRSTLRRPKQICCPVRQAHERDGAERTTDRRLRSGDTRMPKFLPALASVQAGLRRRILIGSDSD